VNWFVQHVRRATAVITIAASSSALPAQAPTAANSLVGRLVPTFAWTSLEDSTAIISPVSLRGSVVLVDLWATWCAPCRREMPFLHEAYARFHKQGLAIVSVSFDVSPGKVHAFRREHFPMPWQHVYATSDIEAEATRIFQVDSFPRTILIDRDGTVLRTDTGLRGPALQATLDSVFAGRVLLPR
jgi:thiol-disulfide isomerase/thioredoxin